MRDRSAVLILICLLASCQSAKVVPVTRGHAHNDYMHARPLRDALDNGFCSIEADIFLVDGNLLVAHEREHGRPDRTLESLYLDPLRKRVRANGGRVYRDGPATITLMIDLKMPAAQIYPTLRRVLNVIATCSRAGMPRVALTNARSRCC